MQLQLFKTLWGHSGSLLKATNLWEINSWMGQAEREHFHKWQSSNQSLTAG
ncbi:MAG: hypothetical protein Q7U91_01915 [Sideroxyarcus sp.]|nr:hypothetical protein [Sideroxyarcus sp.]